DDVPAVQCPSNVDSPLGALDGIAAFGGIVGGVAAVDGLRVLPQSRRDKLCKQAFAIEDFLQLGGGLFQRARVVVDVGDGVVIVELDAIEAELLVFTELGGEGQLLANRRTEWVSACTDVPGTEGKTIGTMLGCRCHESISRYGMMANSRWEEL